MLAKIDYKHFRKMKIYNLFKMLFLIRFFSEMSTFALKCLLINFLILHKLWCLFGIHNGLKFSD